MENVSGFAGAVLHPCVLVLFVVEIAHVDASLGGIDLGAAGGDPDHAHAVRRGRARRLCQDGMKEFGQEERRDVVGAELLLVALDGLAALRGDHDSRIVPENVQSVVLGKEGISCGFDGGQVIEVEMQIDELPLGIGSSRFDALDCGGRFGFGAGEHVDFGIFQVEDVCQLLPNAGRRACHNKDLVGLTQQQLSGRRWQSRTFPVWSATFFSVSLGVGGKSWEY